MKLEDLSGEQILVLCHFKFFSGLDIQFFLS